MTCAGGRAGCSPAATHPCRDRGLDKQSGNISPAGPVALRSAAGGSPHVRRSRLGTECQARLAPVEQTHPASERPLRHEVTAPDGPGPVSCDGEWLDFRRPIHGPDADLTGAARPSANLHVADLRQARQPHDPASSLKPPDIFLLCATRRRSGVRLDASLGGAMHQRRNSPIGTGVRQGTQWTVRLE